MALTTDEKRRAARQFIRTAYRKLNITASVSSEDIEAAASDIYDYLNSAPIQSNLNNQLPEPFKSNATAPEKALMVSVAAMVIAGELPD